MDDDEFDRNPFLNVADLLEKGPQNYYDLRRRQLDEGFRIHAAENPGVKYDTCNEELYSTLFSLSKYGGIVPYQRRCAILHDDDPSPWMRIGRPDKIELLMLILFALAKYSGKDDAAVLITDEAQGMILGFDYNPGDERTEYITGASLLVNFPSHLASKGVLITIKAPDKFVLIQAENKGLHKVVYYHGEFGPIEKQIIEKMRPCTAVERMQRNFWHYNSVLASGESRVSRMDGNGCTGNGDGSCAVCGDSGTVTGRGHDGATGRGGDSGGEGKNLPLPFEKVNLSPRVPAVELAGFVSLIARTRANCLKRKVGCTLVDLYDDGKLGKIRAIGYNGFKSMFQRTDNCDIHFCNKRRYGKKNDALCFSPCAEMDAFRGYHHDAFLSDSFYRQMTRKRDTGQIWTAAVTTIEPCERCTSILFENGVFDFFPVREYKPDRTQVLARLVEGGRIKVTYLGDGFWRKW